jgi:hypothetical protein
VEGGIAILGGGWAQISGNVIATNTYYLSGDGGGIPMNAAGTPALRNNIITGNTATGVSPAADGGGILTVNDSDALIGRTFTTRQLVQATSSLQTALSNRDE